MARLGQVAGSGDVRHPSEVLGFLVKHAHLRLEGMTDAALRELQVTSRELGVLRLIAGGKSVSQQEIAAQVGIDRTSMVALIDSLERKGLVVREPSATDRRRNTVALTELGSTRFVQAEQAAIGTEEVFLAALDDDAAGRFRETLSALLLITE